MPILLSAKNYALSCLFAAAAGAAGTVYLADSYVESKVKSGNSCDVYDVATGWMGLQPQAPKEDATLAAAFQYEERLKDGNRVCFARGVSRPQESLVDAAKRIIEAKSVAP